MTPFVLEQALKTKPQNETRETTPLAVPCTGNLKQLQREARAITDDVILFEPAINTFTRRIDSVVLHPLAGPAIFVAILFFMFQAVYEWSGAPMDMIEAGAIMLGDYVAGVIPDGGTFGWIEGLLVDGIIAGVGSVVVFLPQIIILFIFILALEASGYLARAAFLMDALMLRIGLNRRSLIPLLSSFACAIPGIMAARTIEGERDRLTTILIAPLMTCSARLPVYALIIAAFIKPDRVGPFNQQGLVLFSLYAAGIVSAVIVAFILKHTVTRRRPQPLIMELPTYKLPDPKKFPDQFMGPRGGVFTPRRHDYLSNLYHLVVPRQLPCVRHYFARKFCRQNRRVIGAVVKTDRI